MQRYDGFWLIPNFFLFFILSCSDRETKMRQTPCRGMKSVAKGLKSFSFGSFSLILYEVLEGFVVFRTVPQAAVDEAYQLDGGAEAELLVAGAVDVLIEHILDTIFLEVQA